MATVPDDIIRYRCGGGSRYRGGLAEQNIARYLRPTRVVVSPALAYEMARGAPRPDHAAGLVHRMIRDHGEVPLTGLVSALYDSASQPSTRRAGGILP